MFRNNGIISWTQGEQRTRVYHVYKRSQNLNSNWGVMTYAQLKILISVDFCIDYYKRGKLTTTTDNKGNFKLSGCKPQIFFLQNENII